MHDNNAKASNNLGNAYRKIGDNYKAVENYLLAIQKTHKRKFATAHLNAAATFFDLGDTKSALSHFEEAL